MYVYDSTTMRGWPYRRVLVPSIGHRFPMGTDAPAPNPAQTTMPVNLVRVALLIAAGAVAWKIYSSIRSDPMMPNLPAWPAVGPLFNVGSTIGPAYSLGPFIL